MLLTLFPGPQGQPKLNKEQLEIWRSRVLRISIGEATSALNDYYTQPKQPKDGTIPALPGFLRCVRSSKRDKQTPWKDGDKPSLAFMRRAFLVSHGEPGSSSWTDTEVNAHYAEGYFQQACLVYGPESRLTKHAHEEMRLLRDRLNKTTEPYSEEAAEKIRIKMGGSVRKQPEPKPQETPDVPSPPQPSPTSNRGPSQEPADQPGSPGRY